MLCSLSRLLFGQHGSNQVKITSVVIAQRKLGFDEGLTELTLAISYAGKVVHLALPVSSNPQDDVTEKQEAQRLLREFGHALIEAPDVLQ